jgi:RNA polymerase sigma factor (sigma-70 family)
MMTTQQLPTVDSDAQLVEWSLTGDRDAFAQIVERYKSLVCSITYGATGSLAWSEDLAQETFVTAWKQLTDLHEPSKLRSWLCGITRNLLGKELRRRGHEPMDAAEPLDAIHNSAAPEPLPSAQAISREEEAILWRALERIPETYREPMILFYREQRSVERVAAELELTEDAVKQRLSRGRKLLADEVAAFVEGTLERTTPGKAFTLDVLAMLPIGPATAGAIVAGKGTAAAKSTLGAAWLAPFVGIVAGMGAQWLAIQASTKRERRAKVIAFSVSWILALGIAFGGPRVVALLGHHFGWNARQYFTAMASFWWSFAMLVAGFGVISYRQNRAAPPSSLNPISAGRVAAVVAGTHLLMYWCVMFLAWRAADLLTAGVIAGTMLLSGCWHFVRSRGQTGPAFAMAYLEQLAACCAGLLAFLNVRLDVWLAYWRGISVAEIHSLFPFWLIPAYTLVLVLWVVGFLAVTKPKTRL